MPKPRHVYLIRHGQSMGNVDRTIHATVPDWKVPLTDTGRKQARWAGRDLHDRTGLAPVAFYASPYLRARQTLDEILGAFTPAQIERRREDPRLREQEWSNLRVFDVRMWQQIEEEREVYGTFFYRFAHGESGADVFDRCTGFLSTLYRDFTQETFPDHLCIVTHGFTMRVLLMRWLHWDVETFHQLANPHNAERFEMVLDETDHYRLVTSFPRKGERVWQA